MCFYDPPRSHPFSLGPPRTVEKRLSLFGRHTRLPEKASSWCGSNQLGRWAPTPLDDHQNPDDEPEEEVDPHCRLRRKQHDTQDVLEALLPKSEHTSTVILWFQIVRQFFLSAATI